MGAQGSVEQDPKHAAVFSECSAQACAEDPDAFCLANTSWEPILTEVWQSRRPENVRPSMGVTFSADGAGSQIEDQPAGHGYRYIWTRVGSGVAGGGGEVHARFHRKTYQTRWQDQGQGQGQHPEDLGEPVDTGAVWVFLASNRWMLARFQQSDGYYGFYVFSKSQAQAQTQEQPQAQAQPQPQAQAQAQAQARARPSASPAGRYAGVWTLAFPGRGRHIRVCLDSNGCGLGCDDEMGIDYRLKKDDLRKKKPKQPNWLGMPPTPMGAPWLQSRAQSLTLVLEKSVTLIDGSTLASAGQLVVMRTGGGGLMCINNEGTAEALFLRREEEQAQVSPATSTATPWGLLTLQVSDASLRELMAKQDKPDEQEPGEETLKWQAATEVRPAHVLLNVHAVEAHAPAADWWPAVLVKAERWLVSGSPAQRLWAILVLATAVVVCPCSGSAPEPSESSRESPESPESPELPESPESPGSAALAAIGALTAALFDAHPALRHVARQLLLQLAGTGAGLGAGLGAGAGAGAGAESGSASASEAGAEPGLEPGQEKKEPTVEVEVDVPYPCPCRSFPSLPSLPSSNPSSAVSRNLLGLCRQRGVAAVPAWRDMAAALEAAARGLHPGEKPDPARVCRECNEVEAETLTHKPDLAAPVPTLDLPETQQAISQSLAGTACDGSVHQLQAQARVLLVSAGSRGDAEPLLLLGQQLQARGCDVKALVTSGLLELCNERGIPAEPAWCSLAACFKLAGGVGPDPSDLVRASAQASEAEAESLISPRRLVESFKPDVTVVSLGGDRVDQMAYRWEDELGVPCIQVLGCGTIGLGHQQRVWQMPGRPVLVHTSRFLDIEAPAHTDRGLLQHTGCWLDTTEPSAVELAREPLASLAAFLSAGPPPVAVTWGSMIPKVPPLALLVRALVGVRDAGHRAVVVGGWAKLDASGQMLADAATAEDLVAGLSTQESDVSAVLSDPEALAGLQEFALQRCCFVDAAPHQWLFRQCYCILHHGGAGTTHASLYVGRPCLIAPVSLDQPYWVSRVEGLGVGKGLPQVQGLRAPDVREALKQVGGLLEAAEKLGERMRGEAGLQGAVESVSAFLRNRRNGSWRSRREILLEQAVQPNCTLM